MIQIRFCFHSGFWEKCWPYLDLTEGGYFPVIVVRKRTFRPWRCKGDSQTELMGFANFWLFRATRFLAGNRFQANFKNSFFVLATFYLHLSSRASVDDANFACSPNAESNYEECGERQLTGLNILWIFGVGTCSPRSQVLENFYFFFHIEQESNKHDKQYDVDFLEVFLTEISWWANNHTKKIKDINLNQTVKCGDEEWKKFPLSSCWLPADFGSDRWSTCGWKTTTMRTKTKTSEFLWGYLVN